MRAIPFNCLSTFHFLRNGVDVVFQLSFNFSTFGPEWTNIMNFREHVESWTYFSTFSKVLKRWQLSSNSMKGFLQLFNFSFFEKWCRIVLSTCYQLLYIWPKTNEKKKLREHVESWTYVSTFCNVLQRWHILSTLWRISSTFFQRFIFWKMV